jgi:hypothetical protein
MGDGMRFALTGMLHVSAVLLADSLPVRAHVFCVVFTAVDDIDEFDHPDLLMPPPDYDEAVNVSLYPPTPQMHRSVSSSVSKQTSLSILQPFFLM